MEDDDEVIKMKERKDGVCYYCGEEFDNLKGGVCDVCRDVSGKVKDEVRNELLEFIKKNEFEPQAIIDKIKNL